VTTDLETAEAPFTADDGTAMVALLYPRFRSALMKNAAAFANARDAHDDAVQVEASAAVLEGLMLLLRADPEVMSDPCLLHPLVFAEDALWRSLDLRGRPTNTPGDCVQGTTAFCIDLLVRGLRFKVSEAVAHVVRGTRGRVLTVGNDDLTDEQVAGWRHELNVGRGTRYAVEHRRLLRERYRPLFEQPAPDQRDAHRGRCVALVDGMLKGLWASAPQSAPRRRAKK
jgi:hypothetical protein